MEVSTGPKQVFPQTQTPAPDFTVREKAHKTQQVVHKKKKITGRLEQHENMWQ